MKSMGVEIFQYTFPEDAAPLQMILNNKIDGELLNNYAFLINHLQRGKHAKLYLDSLGDSFSPAELEAIRQTYEIIQNSPHILAICFDEPSRAHDHCAYLLELCQPEKKQLPQQAIFGSQQASTATGTQGIPIKWSNTQQVIEIDEFLQNVSLDQIRSNFNGFPTDRVFYKRRSDEDFESLLPLLRRLKQFYTRAALNKLAVITILD